MKRLGCLVLPRLCIQLHLRDESLPKTTPLVLVEHRSHHTWVRDVSATAEAAGVRLGMTLAQLEIACPEALIREQNLLHYAQQGQTLLARLLHLTPLVEAERMGRYFIGLEGLRWLYRDDVALMQAALAIVQEEKLEAGAGIAGTRFAASVAARLAPPFDFMRVPDGQDSAFLAPLALTTLPLSAELLERLKLLGLTTVGEFAALPAKSIERRYAKEGLEAYVLATARDPYYLEPDVIHEAERQALQLEYPVADTRKLVHLMSPLLESLLAKLHQRGLACRGLNLALKLDRQGMMEIPLSLGSPITTARPLLELAQLKLERVQLDAGVIEIAIEPTRTEAPSTPQTDLFQRSGSPSNLALTLARLKETLGPDVISMSREVDAFPVEQRYMLQPIDEHNAQMLRVPLSSRNGVKERRRESPPASPHGVSTSDLRLEPASIISLANGFRRLEKPRLVHFQQDVEGPTVLVTQGRQRQILSRHGPFRFSGAWWKQFYDRDYYRLRLSDGVEVLAFCNRLNDEWYLEGIFD